MSERVIIAVNEGKVRGIKQSSTFSKTEYYSFFGVPYAEQPIGNLRFQDPVKVKPWKNVYNATKEKPGCIQFSLITFNFCGSEDCLFNNIYIPRLPQKNEPLRPVVVNIHPGAFHHGSPQTCHFGSPNFVMHNDIVYVCIGYRIHILGFLNLGMKECSGNQALKDIILSLQWIKDNIASFGGDPENISVLGASSGGALIQALMLSPAAKGIHCFSHRHLDPPKKIYSEINWTQDLESVAPKTLKLICLFHKAVIMSGYLMNPIAPFQETNKHHAIEVAKLLGYKKEPTDYEKILKFLKRQPFAKLYQKQSQYQNELQQNIAPITTIGVFAPTNDPVILPCPPVKLIKSIMRIPVMTGFSERETVMGFIRGDNRQKTEQYFMTTFCQNQWGWGYDLNEDDVEIIKQRVESFYTEDQPVINASLSIKVDIQTDITMSDFYDTLIDPISTNPPTPVYVFKFEFEGNMPSIKELELLDEELQGTYHATEFCYWNRFSDPRNEETYQMIEKFTKLVATFAQNGDPNHEGSETRWKPSTPQNPCYLSIDTTMKLVDGRLNNLRLEFWDDVKKHFKRDVNSRDCL